MLSKCRRTSGRVIATPKDLYEMYDMCVSMCVPTASLQEQGSIATTRGAQYPASANRENG